MITNYYGPTAFLEKFKESLIKLNEESPKSTKFPTEHKIHLQDDAEKHVNLRPYRASPYQKEAINSHIKDLLDKKYIQESNSSFSSPIVLVKKSDGGERFCVDYRIRNKYTIRDRFPLPRIDETLDALGSAEYFSKSGYYTSG
jgi:hypothetical protein